jgi:hypothetical protein
MPHKGTPIHYALKCVWSRMPQCGTPSQAPSVKLPPPALESDNMNFTPHNDLEEKLAAVHAGTLDPETFVMQLIDQQLFVPVRDEKNPIKGFQRSTQAELLVIEDEEGERVLVAFTSPERAKPFVEHYPEYSGGILTEFSWLLRRLGGGVPIALNPGWDIGMDFDADMVAQLVAQLPPEHTA